MEEEWRVVTLVFLDHHTKIVKKVSMQINEPLVSVVMITYEHESYIEKAINGVFIQKTKFPVKLIIANDDSQDNSDEIIKKKILLAPPNITVKYTKHSGNKGMIPNLIWALEQCSSKYVALCEGDDYWTDPLKLQKQVDFLERNLEYNLSCHNATIINHKTKESRPFNLYLKKGTFVTKDIIIKPWFIPTASIVWKRNLNIDFKSNMTGDMVILYLNSLRGKIHYLDDIMSVYNFFSSEHSQSGKYKDRSQLLLAMYKNKFNFLRYVDQQSNYRFFIYTTYKRAKISLGFLYSLFIKR